MYINFQKVGFNTSWELAQYFQGQGHFSKVKYTYRLFHSQSDSAKVKGQGCKNGYNAEPYVAASYY